MDAGIERRIERIVNNLLPETAFRNRYGEKATLADRMAYHNTPGVSIAVINSYEIEWGRGFGVRERGKQDPVTDETLFQAGSISKPVFALAVMLLVQEGKLDLDEEVNNYLTSWKIPANGDWQPRVTLRQLLSHSAGLTVHGFPGYMRTEYLPTVVQILDGHGPSNTPAIRVNIIPGTQFRYSGGGTTVAQQLVVDVLGKPFPEIMRNLVLDPLGMDHSTYEQSLPDDWAGSAATAHPWKYRPVDGKWHVYPEMAAAGLWTTPSDLARLGIELQLTLRGESNRILSADVVNQMLTPQVEDGIGTQVADHIGIGFFLKGKEEAARFGHGGWDEGFVSRMTVYKHLGMGAAIMINSNQGAPMISEIERAIALEYGWPDYFLEKKVVSGVASEVLDAYVGEYVAKSGFQFTVTREDRALFLRPAGQPPVEMHAESETKFFIKTVNAEVVFEKAEDGAVTGLTLHQSERQISAEKKRRICSDAEI